MNKITRKSDRIEFCKSYLSDVKKEAKAIEIYNYIITNTYGRNRVAVSPSALGMLMRGRPDLFDKRRVGGKGTVYYWKLKEPISLEALK
ncbi:MAG: hypothetical protein Q8M92_04760 [Candidatus Subteraquimicrobiales bacterium]|nr:hypothetical protein [Candidatus Subteraquimicrobiales bacterium]